MAVPRTLNDLVLAALLDRGRPDAFRHKVEGAYRDVSSEEFARGAAEFSRGLLAMGLVPGDRVALLSETRLLWAMADVAVLAAGGISVPIYPTLQESAVDYAVRDSGARLVIVSTAEQARKALACRSRMPELRVIVFDPDPSVPEARSLDDVRQAGREAGADLAEFRRRAERVGPDQLATIIYTSGTTGDPKGVMLTHGNIVSNVLASVQVFPLSAADRYLSVLPLSHVLERMAGYYTMLHVGVPIAYAESFHTVAQNMLEVAPTVMVCVPRLFEKMYARALETAVAGGSLSRAVFHWAVATGGRAVRLRQEGRAPGPFHALAHRAADLLVFRKVRRRTGGRIRFFVSGGAPLGIEIAEFFFAARLPVLEGYGLTESSPVIAVDRFEAPRLGTVGPAIPGVEIRIAEDGEILARGPSIMAGYYQRPEATAQALQDGWLHTGDIGFLDAGGYLHITDRKKDLIVTAGGKKVAPQPIESRLVSDRFINMAMVLGDRRPFLVALVVPDFHALERYARYKKIDFRDRADLVLRPEIRDLIARRIESAQEGAASYETIKNFLILSGDLDQGHNQLTPTLKVKRRVVAEQFAAQIEALYAAGESAPAASRPS